MKSSILTASLVAEYDVNKDSIPARRAMSKNLRPIQLFPAAFVLILQFFTFATGQEANVTVKITAGDVPSAKVKVQFAVRDSVRTLWFLDEYAGITDLLAKRYSAIDFRDKQGLLIARRKFSGSDSFSTRNVGSVEYIVNLKPLAGTFATAHTSWIDGDVGLIMLDDLLPTGWAAGQRTNIRFELPSDWRTYTSEPLLSEVVLTRDRVRYSVSNIEKAVFVIGRNLRQTNTSSIGARVHMVVSGEWKFSDAEAAKHSALISDGYVKTFGSAPTKRAQIAILRFPAAVPHGNWEADTRGSSITIASSDMPFPNQSLQRLHEQLRHEIFHLWIPNGVNLTGNYDWFYEGFALYQSLKMGVAVNRIRFDDYLDTLSRAYAIDARRSNITSMVEASRNRWSGSNTDVYARGMLVAFLCDVAMLDASKGKRSTTDLLREIFSKHGGEARSEEGNAAILAVMKRYPELIPITERYVTGAEKLDWASSVKAAGIDADAKDGRLSVSTKLSGRQKDLLDKLGYNSWRKLANEKR